MAEDYVLQTKITADSTQFDATLKKTGKSLTAFSSEITNVTKLLGTLFVGQKIVKFAKTSVDSIEKERKELNLLNTTLKTTGATAWTTQQQLVDMAKAFESESNYTSEQIQRAQTVMLGFKTVTGDVFNSAMQNVLDMSEVMGMDLVSAVQTVGKALDDPVKGLGSLQRQGFAFSESQKAMLEEMVKTGRQAEAQKIILDELATTYGGAAKAGQNAFQQLNIAVGNLQKVIGENLAPVIESIATDITELINQFNSLDKGTQTFILTAGSLLTTLPLVVKGVNALKVALVSLQTSVPVLLAITAGIAGISAIVGAVVKKKNEFSELSKEITKISSTTKNYLDTYSEGNEEKKLDEKATKELIKLYPELSGKVSAYTTSVEDARNAVNDLVNQKLIDAESSGIKDYIQKLNEIEKLNEEVNKLTSHKNELDEKMAKEIQNISIPAIQKLADEERNSINERLKAIGKLLTLEGSIIELPIEITPPKNIETTKKSWQEALKEVLKIDDDFSTGKEAVNIYLSNMEEALKQDKRISEALGEKFDIGSALKAQQEQISQVIADLLQQTDIDKPFDIEELSRESTALGSLAQAYKQMGEVISSTNQTISEESTEWADKLLAQEIAILEKRRDNEIEWAKNAKKSEDEIYAIRADYVEKINELQVKQLNSQRDAEIKKVKNSKQSAESQKKIISQINEYYDKQIDLMNEATERFTKKSGGFLEEWSKQYQSLAGNWTQTFVDMANIATSAMGEMFETIGQGLVDNGIGYEDFASTAIEALSEVLKGLAAQLSALAAVNAATYNYGQAAAAAAGAAAALVAAGTLKAVSNSLKKVDDTAKSTNTSLDEFVKRIQNIKETSFSKLGTFDKGVLEYSNTISEATKEMKKAYEEYDRLRNKHTKDDFWHSRGPFAWFDNDAYHEWEDEVEDALNTYNSWAKKIGKANRDIVKSFGDLSESSKNIVKENSAVSYSYQELFKSINEVAKLKNTYKRDLLEYGLLMGALGSPGDPSKTEYFQYQKYSAYLETLTNNIKAQVQEMANDVYESMLSVGKDIGETFVSSIVDGVKKEDFMLSIKDYMKKQMTKLVILTDEFSDRIAGLGLKLISAMTSEDAKEPFEEIRNELSSLYDEAETKAKAIESVLTDVFGKVKDSTDEAKLSIAELKAQVADLYKGGGYLISVKGDWKSGYIINLKKTLAQQLEDAVNSQKEAIEEVIRSYYESLKTVGSSMAGIISSGFQEGLSKEDLKLSIKEWIKNQLIESTIYEVYAEKLARIGAEIAGYMTHGQMEYLGQVSEQIDSIYEGMTETLQSIDSVLDQTFGVKMEESAESVEEELEKIEESFTKFEKAMRDFTDTISDLGGDVASNFISSLSSGLDTDSALLGFKKFLREYIIKAYVFTESMKSEIEKIGSLIGKTLDGSISEKELSDVANAVKTTYGKLADSMKTVDTLLDSVFGKEAEKEVSSGADTVVESVSKIQKAIDNLKDNLADLGGDVANNFISSLNSGLDLDSALISFKEFIRNYVIQSAVYTDSLKSEIEKIGQGIADYILGKNGGLETISDDFKKTYEKLAGDISKADEYLDKIFGKEKEEEIKDTTNTITKELSKIESAMESFKETVSDLGGDIASNLIEGLSNGLSQGDFLSNMKDWIRKMLVQSIVYTEQMKSQIEEIGKAISNAISGGFTETSMHEIRRDLSFIFEQATAKMSGIDKVLGGVFDGYATGTNSALKGLHIVGEAGPELVNFRGGEQVYNNRDTMGMLSENRTNNFNVTFNNLRDTSAFAMMNQLKQYNRELAVNGVI